MKDASLSLRATPSVHDTRALPSSGVCTQAHRPPSRAAVSQVARRAVARFVSKPAKRRHALVKTAAREAVSEEDTGVAREGVARSERLAHCLETDPASTPRGSKRVSA
jgi:hypothetical protein